MYSPNKDGRWNPKSGPPQLHTVVKSGSGTWWEVKMEVVLFLADFKHEIQIWREMLNTKVQYLSLFSST